MKRPKILTPFNDMDYLEPLADAGADEFYMGFCDENWKQRFGAYSDVNRLTLFKSTANRYTLQDIPAIAERIHSRNGSLYITLNAPGYHAEAMPVLEDYIQELAAGGADGIITSTPELISPIRSAHLKAVASTMCGITTADAALFFRNQGIQRIIFPREVSSADMESIVTSVPDLEYEVFLMRNGCRYSDANCLGLHGGDHGALCYSLRNGETEYFSRQQDGGAYLSRLAQAHETFCSEFHEMACGQCALFRFMQLGIRAVKIVGRLDDMDEVLRDVDLTRRNIDIAARCKDESQYLNEMILPGDFAEYCRYGLSCYYPEIRWQRQF